MIVKQVLLVSSLENVERKVGRTSILMLGSKEFHVTKRQRKKWRVWVLFLSRKDLDTSPSNQMFWRNMETMRMSKVVLGISLVNVRSAILMKSRLTEDFSEDYITAGAVACMVWSHGYQVTILSHARVTRTKEARDFKLGLKGKIMAGSVFFRAILLPSYFGRNLRTYFGCTII